MTKPAKSWRRWGKIALAVAVLTLAGVLSYRVFSQYSLDDIYSSLQEIPAYRILLALACAAGSYFCLTWFDWLGLRYAGKPLAYPKAAVASFTALSLGHNIGFAALSSGAVRYRFYSRWGLSTEQVAKVILFCGVTVGLGLATTGGLAVFIQPGLVEEFTYLSRPAVMALGVTCLAFPVVYVLLAAFVTGVVRIRTWTFEMPSVQLAAAQVLVGTANYLFVSACLYQGMAEVTEIPYLDVAAGYIVANTLSLFAHVPGGVGVIESVMMLLLSKKEVIGALVVFRVIYFLVPLMLGGLLFLAMETIGKRQFATS